MSLRVRRLRSSVYLWSRFTLWDDRRRSGGASSRAKVTDVEIETRVS